MELLKALFDEISMFFSLKYCLSTLQMPMPAAFLSTQNALFVACPLPPITPVCTWVTIPFRQQASCLFLGTQLLEFFLVVLPLKLAL